MEVTVETCTIEMKNESRSNLSLLCYFHQTFLLKENLMQNFNYPQTRFFLTYKNLSYTFKKAINDTLGLVSSLARISVQTYLMVTEGLI